MWRSCSIKIRALKIILSSPLQVSAPFLKCFRTLSPQVVFLSLHFPYNLFHVSKTRYSVIIRAKAADSLCLLYCICSILHALAMIKPIPCHIFSNSPGRVTSAPACHRSHKSIPQDPSSHQHFYLLLLLQLALTCKCGNTSSQGSTKQIIFDFTPSFSYNRDRAETQLCSGIWNLQCLLLQAVCPLWLKWPLISQVLRWDSRQDMPWGGCGTVKEMLVGFAHLPAVCTLSQACWRLPAQPRCKMPPGFHTGSKWSGLSPSNSWFLHWWCSCTGTLPGGRPGDTCQMGRSINCLIRWYQLEKIPWLAK